MYYTYSSVATNLIKHIDSGAPFGLVECTDAFHEHFLPEVSICILVFRHKFSELRLEVKIPSK